MLQRTIFWTGLLSSVFFIAWMMAVDHERALERCMERSSQDTCLYSLR
jgi:hypothetical protein